MSFKRLADTMLKKCNACIGEPLSYVPVSTGVAEVINGIFDNNYVLAEANGVGVQSTVPAIKIREADLSVTPAEGDVVTIDGESYCVIERKPDSEGGAILVLHET